MKAIRVVLLSVFAFGVMVFTNAQPAEPSPRSARGVVRGVVIPIYLKNHVQAAAVVRLESVFQDHEQKGFFRIGLLPMLVGEGVVVEFRESHRVPEVLSKAHEWLQNLEQLTLEWRGVRFMLGSETTPRLQAERIKLVDREHWRLSGNVTVRTSTNQIRLRNAVLHLAGAKTGLLTWNSTNSLAVFGQAESNLIKPKETK